MSLLFFIFLKMIATESDILSGYARQVEQVIFAYNMQLNRFEFLNAGFERVLNRDRTFVDPASLIEMVHAEDREYLKKCFYELQNGIKEKDIEFRIQTLQRKDKWIHAKVFVSKEHTDSTIIMGFAEDITPQKDHIHVLSKYADKKNAVLNILSHDLAAPLGSILNISFLLKSRLKNHEDKEVHQLLGLIEKITQKGTKLIQNFVKEEFIQSAEAAIVPIRINILEKLQQLVEEYQAQQHEMKQTFHFEASGEPVFIKVDETKFMQVVNNLLSNAIKFTPAGGHIYIHLEEMENAVLLQIRDTGIGIPQKYHARLFDKFSDARRTGINGEPSVGLGMSIIKTILNWHQANITFESKEGVGTIFNIEIPRL
ncbi:MAG: sensor histidine kinase [Daejeonella sp.]|nr:sensor histidine kinase [Daejeonella sp.]